LSEDGLVRRPPLRVPHRAASTVALIGGSTSGLAPGELSLAHNGILLLEGITDFSPDILDSVRHALDRGTVRLTRGSTTTELPARFQLIATMSPCPCGLGHGGCTCTGSERVRHLRSVPGPLMSRFDVRLPLAASGGAWPERSDVWAAAASRVTEARDRRREAAAGSADAPMSARASELLQRWVREGRLSGRGESQLCAVAQTLADLSGRGAVDSDTVSLALDLHGDPHQLFKPPGNRDVDSESVRRTPLPTTADGRGGGGSERSRARLDAYARRADSGAAARPYGTEPPPASNGLT
jgi:magnesium chelatase family protein